MYKEYIMGELTGDDLKIYNENKDRYSADTQRIVYQIDQTSDIYRVNQFLLIFYYIFLIYYTFYAYPTFRYSNQYYKKLFMILFLFIYPFVIYPIQYWIYQLGNYMIQLVYTNVYNEEGW